MKTQKRNIQLYNSVNNHIQNLEDIFNPRDLYYLLIVAIKTNPSEDAEIDLNMLLSATGFIERLDNPCQKSLYTVTLKNIVSCFEVPPEYEFEDPSFHRLDQYLDRNPMNPLQLADILSDIPQNQFPELYDALEQTVEGIQLIYGWINNWKASN